MKNNIINDKVLEVKNLRVSFRTNTGTVKAVRGINFALQRGKTLAIVGESGSGKSVTSKAILGILANNKIVEDGQIIYDGKDLLKVSEDQFTKIRGVKISMIFQDPLSSLNPIMKVGKQLTEAMYLKAKSSRKEAKKDLNRFLNVFAKCQNTMAYGSLKKFINSIKDFKLTSDDNSYLVDEVYNETLNFKDLFIEGINLSLEKQKVAIDNAINSIIQFKSMHFNGLETFNAKETLKANKNLNKVLKACRFDLRIDTDDVLEVFTTSMAFYLNSFIDSIKMNSNREKLLAQYNVESVYDLPADVRVKQSEVIADAENCYEKMISLIDELIEHLNNLLNASPDYEGLCDELIHFFSEKIVESKSVLTKEETKRRAIKIMEEVGINEAERRFNQYPFEFSGGMRQRIVIAIALSSNPEVLICDEPTTALDVTIQAQILELINKLKVEKNLSIIFITHDLGVVANMADDIAVMYAGKIVEYGSVYDIFYDPRHPYTWALLSSMPDLQTSEKLDAIPGTPPNMLLPPKGDAFAARNKYAMEIDYEEQPPFFEVSPTHYAATWLLDEDAPDVVAPRIVSERIYNSLSQNSDNKPEYTLKKNSILEYKGGK